MNYEKNYGIDADIWCNRGLGTLVIRGKCKTMFGVPNLVALFTSPAACHVCFDVFLSKSHSAPAYLQLNILLFQKERTYFSSLIDVMFITYIPIKLSIIWFIPPC